MHAYTSRRAASRFKFHTYRYSGMSCIPQRHNDHAEKSGGGCERVEIMCISCSSEIVLSFGKYHRYQIMGAVWISSSFVVRGRVWSLRVWGEVICIRRPWSWISGRGESPLDNTHVLASCRDQNDFCRFRCRINADPNPTQP